LLKRQLAITPLAGAIPTRSKRRKPEILLLYRGLATFQATLIVDILPP
jgi:hypothetical protein